ncbi:hypothetical protein M7I_6511 [Glarea lozoyensis 74030]|uniref:Uncharacterized protein n=1 Tax=Glarea lozoyensis (strain ATCC 74030 / MF5533) TaxID=1104152 RepID=H0EUS2_GLAL7|nr:hypothetical protein M7I_6511 [Glarea lozoyensis 74030]
MHFTTAYLSAMLAAYAAATPVASPIDSVTLLPRAPPEGKILIGYRSCSKAEAKSTNKIGSIYWNDKMYAHYKASGQYGVGKSLADRAGEWESFQDGAPWYCYVLADEEAFKAQPKAYLEEPEDGVKWTEARAVEAIQAIEGMENEDPDEVLRFGGCGHYLLPSGKSSEGGPLGLETKCFDSLEAMKEAMEEEGLGDAPIVRFHDFEISGTASFKRGLELEARGKKDTTANIKVVPGKAGGKKVKSDKSGDETGDETDATDATDKVGGKKVKTDKSGVKTGDKKDKTQVKTGGNKPRVCKMK